MSAWMHLDKKALWKKFPIVLKPYNPEWETWYQEEKDRILKTFIACHVRRVSHIGSTAIKGLVAKPTVDILLEVDDNSSLKPVAKKLLELDYLTEGDVEDPPLKMVFMKGYTESGYQDRVFHLHLRLHDDHDELYFRDYLLEHEAVREAYATLKYDLQKKYRFHRDHYTDGKGPFIRKWTEAAKSDYKGRYAPHNG